MFRHKVEREEPCGRLLFSLLVSYSMLSMHRTDGDFYYIASKSFLSLSSASLPKS